MQDSVGGDERLLGVGAYGSGMVSLTRAIQAEEAEDREDPLVLAAEVYNPVEAEIILGLLTAHDIPCLLKAENPYAVDATYTLGPLARRRILVLQSDLPRAKDILAARPESEAREE